MRRSRDDTKRRRAECKAPRERHYSAPPGATHFAAPGGAPACELVGRRFDDRAVRAGARTRPADAQPPYLAVARPSASSTIVPRPAVELAAVHRLSAVPRTCFERRLSTGVTSAGGGRRRPGPAA